MKPREAELLTFIDELTEARGFPPTMRELAVAMRVSLTRVAQLVASCTREGWLARHPKIARSFRVLRSPTGGEVR